MKLIISVGVTCLIATAMAGKLAEGLCKVPAKDFKTVMEIYDEQFDIEKCPYGDACRFTQLVRDMTKQRINDTKMAPCVYTIEAKKRRGSRKKFINNDIPFNCFDNECDVAIDLRGIWGYGCWCNFGSKLLNGKGSPVSKHDQACKNMQLCLRCAEMDGSKDGYECSPRTVSYNTTLGPAQQGQNDNINSFNSACAALNQNDPCAAHVCTCEIQLINEILGMVWTLVPYDIAPRHANNPFGGTFDPSVSCLSDPGITEIDCCGKYPFRSTYNSLNKSCCKGKIEQLFNPMDQICCADGIMPIGNAC